MPQPGGEARKRTQSARGAGPASRFDARISSMKRRAKPVRPDKTIHLDKPVLPGKRVQRGRLVQLPGLSGGRTSGATALVSRDVFRVLSGVSERELATWEDRES